VAGAEAGASEYINVLSREEQVALLGHANDDPQKFHGDDADTGNALYTEYNLRLKGLLETNVEPGDIVCHSFGHAHATAADTHRGINIETGIGYPQTHYPFRVFESYAWMHWHLGRHDRSGSSYEWVIPNYFVAEEWPVVTTSGSYVLYFGRLAHIKGCHVVAEIAKRMPDTRFILCGQGDPTPFLTSPNIEYRPPVTGTDRAALLGGAMAVLMPTQYVEPFGGVSVEAMLTGTPVLASPFGAFPEIITQGTTGFLPRVLAEWIDGIRLAQRLDRAGIAADARRRYSLEAVGPMYDAVFTQLHALFTGGDWYSWPGRWTTTTRTGVHNAN
jgi:glycosyltransferase involved in cell wall biosynthesis